ncbi:hypothetical protein EV586_102506 [Tumebacillus sp. BK434]|uniref:hypothetical protein n=1 Tax=Tumebacillus sp. BK434 TaxID=2512169 RepID=UPI0010E5FB4E|nr:hypothetical protein [Tumebacillus sp. BK434]TCP58058.1 hypothetical protein EV586_102506 [Tumebacillus sp. BK434]
MANDLFDLDFQVKQVGSVGTDSLTELCSNGECTSSYCYTYRTKVAGNDNGPECV